MSLSILIRGTGDPYTSLTAAKAADNIKKALDPTTAGQWIVAGSKEELTAALALNRLALLVGLNSTVGK